MRKNFLLGITGVASVLVFALWYRGPIQGSQDINVYKNIGSAVAETRASGADVRSEYPPLPSALFFLLDRVPGTSFGDSWIVFVIILVAGAWLCAAKTGEKEAYLFPLAIAATIVLLGQETVLARFDIAVAAVLFVAWRAHARGRDGIAMGFLLTAGALKIVPLLLVPLLVPGSSVIRWKRTGLGAVVAIIACTSIALAVMGPGGIHSNLTSLETYHNERGIQAESTWSGVRMLFDRLRGGKSELGNHHMALHNQELGSKTQLASALLMITGPLALGFLAWKKRNEKNPGRDTLFLAGLAWVLAVSPILSPQFLVWLLPLLIWHVLSSVRDVMDTRTMTVGILTLIIGFSTQWIFPFHYGELIGDQTLRSILLLNLRNIALLVLSGALLFEALGGFAKRNPVKA